MDELTQAQPGTVEWEVVRVRNLLAFALNIPVAEIGAHHNNVYYESPFVEINGENCRFQTCVYWTVNVLIQWDRRVLGEKSWYYQEGWGFWGNPDPLPEPLLFGRIMHCFGCETDLLSMHEKMELRLDVPQEFWPQQWLDELAKRAAVE